MNTQKRKMYLDLNTQQPKRTRLLKQQSVIKPELLSSPDVQKLKLASPDLEKFITNPHSLVTPTQVFFPKHVTAEQELYAKGFEDALAQLSSSNNNNNNNDNSNSNSNSMSSAASSISDSDYKQDMMTNGQHPIDMESQEKIKLERKRQRNRIAASKCRKRKLERIAKLEDKVKLLKNENEKLNDVLDKMRGNVDNLKEKIMGHVQAGCAIMVNND
jgi:transcription factor AP-1